MTYFIPNLEADVIEKTLTLEMLLIFSDTLTKLNREQERAFE